MEWELFFYFLYLLVTCVVIRNVINVIHRIKIFHSIKKFENTNAILKFFFFLLIFFNSFDLNLFTKFF